MNLLHVLGFSCLIIIFLACYVVTKDLVALLATICWVICLVAVLLPESEGAGR